MSNDLVSREALKKVITNRLASVTYNSDYTNGLQDGYLNAIEDIDNAPAVEMYSFETFRNICCKTCEEKSRPQGEWRYRGLSKYCSNCGKNCEQNQSNFCGNCGADMRGNAEK